MKGKMFLPLLLCLALTACAERYNSADETVTLSETTVIEAAERLPENDWDYGITGGKAHIRKYIGEDTEVTVPETLEGCPVTGINRLAFEGSGITSLTIPENVPLKAIGKADKLVTLNLPRSTKELSIINFTELYSLEAVNIPEGGEHYRSENGVLYSADGSKLVLYPPAREGEFIVPENVKVIGDYSFCDSRLSSLILPDELTEIGCWAFRNCNMPIIAVPDSVNKLAYSIINSDSETVIEFDADGDAYRQLTNRENIAFRNETQLKKAVRTARDKYEGLYEDGCRLVFSDIDNDNFPELFVLNEYYGNSLLKYSSEEGWKALLYGDYGFLALYREPETDEYFFVLIAEEYEAVLYELAEIITFDENGTVNRRRYGSSDVAYPMGEYDNGIFMELLAGNEYKLAEYSGFGFQAEDYKKMHEDFMELTLKSLSEYECVYSIDLSGSFRELSEKYPANEKGMQVFFEGEFADEMSESRYRFMPVEEFTDPKGGFEYTKFSHHINLDSDVLSPEFFEEISKKVPDLTRLSISGDEVDLTGIEHLTGLKTLHISAKRVTGGESLKDLDIASLSVSGTENIDFVSNLDSLIIFESYRNEWYMTEEETAPPDYPSDYFAPLYGIDTLKYIRVSEWHSGNMTAEQGAHIRAHRPDILFCRYKIG